MQAYPFQHKDPTTGLTNISVGMTLRDYFAAQALHTFNCLDIEDEKDLCEQMATYAYRLADAMMEARK
jgi:hypothetical protein